MSSDNTVTSESSDSSGSSIEKDSNAGLTMKLFVDRRANKVAFAEAGKDAVNFLFSLLTLPIGTALTAFSGAFSAPMAGCAETLYGSLKAMDGAYVESSKNRDIILSQLTTKPSLLQPLLTVSSPRFFTCDTQIADDMDKGRPRRYSNCLATNFTDVYGALCPSCSCPMTKEFSYVGQNIVQVTQTELSGSWTVVRDPAVYMVTDDMSVSPLAATSVLAVLGNLGVRNLTDLDQVVVKLGIEQAIQLFNACMQSKTALTDVFLREANNKRKRSYCSGPLSLFNNISNQNAVFLSTLLHLKKWQL